MDSITHGLAGAMIARAGFERSLGRWGQTTGFLIALFPDIDFLFRFFGEEFFLRYHRGITHSILFLPFFSLIFAVFFNYMSGLNRLTSFFALCFLAITSHIILDLMTSFGTMILAPLSDRRFAWDILFILDPYFTGILIIPFILSPFLKHYRQGLAILSISLLIFYTGFCAYNHYKAIYRGYGVIENNRFGDISLSALPQPLSPYRWMVIVDSWDKIYQNFINVGRKEYSVQKIEWDKRLDSPWVKKALELEGVEFYMWFARFPVALERDMPDDHHLVEFIDLRFYIGRDTIPFTYRVEFNDEGDVILERFTTINNFKENYGRG